ncbi:peroxide stress protein YaaA [Nostocoides veronense]|uniref:Peroxide stress protein YaaA n=1 Tax=Nostocoides veronense TaxID=330836 RepID=A0ABN2LAY0_9MICO
MLILLPPSETKARPRRGAAMRVEALSFPELTGVREEIIDGLVAASALPDAMSVLGVPATLGEEVQGNLSIRTRPARPALEIYQGVLYDALDAATLSPVGKRRAARRLVLSSAVYGVVRAGDRIAPYRTDIGAHLPGVGRITARWKESLAPALDAAAGTGLIVDCRSGPYAATWTPNRTLAARWVAVRVPGASHMAKHARGLVARALCESAADPKPPAGLIPLLENDFEVTLTEPERPGRPWQLDVLQS